MARQKSAAARARRKNGSSRTTHRSARRKTSRTALTRARRVMSNAVSDDVSAMRGEVNQLIGDLEDRLNRLNRLTKSGASHAVDGVNDLMYGAVTSLTDPVRDRARAVSNDAAKMGHQALRRIGTEIDQHPLLTLAIAAGIGFIAGMARRAD
jgi:ElaB/YqjD/DUF883 family membrane-anchored ribosome-binding protein